MGEAQVVVPPAIHRKLHDPSIMLEEYLYYAAIQREQEKRGLGPEERELYYQNLATGQPTEKGADVNADEKVVLADDKSPVNSISSAPTPAEWETASRAARNAKWSTV
jgi:hypothetical protein